MFRARETFVKHTVETQKGIFFSKSAKILSYTKIPLIFFKSDTNSHHFWASRYFLKYRCLEKIENVQCGQKITNQYFCIVFLPQFYFFFTSKMVKKIGQKFGSNSLHVWPHFQTTERNPPKILLLLDSEKKLI